MLNNYEETSSGFTNNHVQTPASIPRTVETQKQQNIGPTWSYNSQLEGLYGCYQNEHQPVYNIHSMGHFEGNTKHNSNPYPQYSTGSIHQPVPTPLGKCHEACCQHLSDRYPINPAPLRYPPNGSVQPPRYGEISSNEHRQYFTERRPIQSSISRKKEFQAENGYSTGPPPDRHFQYVGRGQIHVPERQSVQMIRSQYPMYPINSYWSPRNWSGPRMGYPPPPPYHQSVTNQTSQLQSNLKMTEPPHYIDPSVSKTLSSQQRRALMRNANTNPEIVRPIPETKRPSGNASHLQGCYDFPYHSGFVPFNEVNKMSSSIPSQVNNSSCKVPIDKQFQQHQFTISNNERAMTGCNNPLGDIAYAYPPGSYMRNSSNGLQQMSDSRKLSLQYEQQSLGKKRPDLDVRQFLATWDDDEEDGTRMSEPIHNNSNLAPYIVVDCRSLEGETTAKLQERVKGSVVQNCQSKPQNENSSSLNNVEPKSTETDEIVLRDTDPQRSLIHSEYPQNSYSTTLHNDSEKNLSFWNPENRENCPESDSMMGKGAFQPLDCTKRDNMNVVEPIMTSKRDPLLHGDMNHKLINNDPTSHMSFDALVTYYGDSRRVGDGSYDLVEMTERLVNASDKICTIERNPLEQDMTAEGLHPCDPRNLQNQMGGNQSFHHRLPTRYASNNYQHYKSGINNDTFFNFKYPVGSSKFFGFDSSNLDPNYDYHKSPSEFNHQKSFMPKDKIINNYQSSTLSKNLDKIDLQDIGKKANILAPDASKKHHTLNSYQIPEKNNLDFGVDPEQFITPIIIKKSDYYNKENYSDVKSSKVNSELMEEGNGKTVLMHSNPKQVYHETNIVTLHSADQTENNTVTVEVPYDEQYSSLVKLSEEITEASKGDSTKILDHHIKETNHGKSKTDSKEKSEQTVLKKSTSFKLKRLPNSKEWIKVGGDTSLELKNAKHKNATETIPDNPKPALNLNMPSLDDIRFIDESENKNNSNSSLKSTENNNSEEIPGFSKSPIESKTSFTSDNIQLTQLAIVPPMTYPAKNGDEMVMENQSLEDELIDHSKHNFDSNEENFLNTDSNHAKDLGMTSQFSVIHSPYDTITLGDSHSPFVDLGSKLQSTSDSQTNIEPTSSTVIDTFISESTKLEHNYSDVKTIQNTDDYTSTNQCLDINNDEMLCSGNTEHERNKEPFSPFHTYSECDINSHMSAYFKVNNRICNSNKDIEPCIPSSPGVEEMFEDINHVSNDDNTFLEKSEQIPFVSERDIPVIKSPCCRSEAFCSNTYNLSQQNSLEAPLSTTNCSLDFDVEKSEIFSKSEGASNSKTDDNLTVKTLPAIPPINLKLNERKKIWCIAKKPKNFDPKPKKDEDIEPNHSNIVNVKPKDAHECSLSPSSCKCDANHENIPDTLNCDNFSHASPISENLVDTNIGLECFSETITEDNEPSECSVSKLSDLNLQHTSENKNVGGGENSNQKDLEHLSLLSSCEDSVIDENCVNNDSLLPSALSVESNCDFQGFANVDKDNENYEIKEQTSEKNGFETSDSLTNIREKEDHAIKQLADNVEHPLILFQGTNGKIVESDDNELSQLIPVINTDGVNLVKVTQESEEIKIKENEEGYPSPPNINMIKDNLFIQDLETETSKNEDCDIESCSISNCNYSCSMLHLSDDASASFTTDEGTARENPEKSSVIQSENVSEVCNPLSEKPLHNSVIVTDYSVTSENPPLSLENKIDNTENIELCHGQVNERFGSDININKAKELNEVSLVDENLMEGDKSLQEFENESMNENVEQVPLVTTSELKSNPVNNYSNNVSEKKIKSSEDNILEGICQVEHCDINKEVCENLTQTFNSQTDCDNSTCEENNTDSNPPVTVGEYNELVIDKKGVDRSIDNITQENVSCSKFENDCVDRENDLHDTLTKTNSIICKEDFSSQQRNNQENSLNLCPIVKFGGEDLENPSTAEYITKMVQVPLNDDSLLQNIKPDENQAPNMKIYENLDTNDRDQSVSISENNKISNNLNLKEDGLKTTGTNVNFETEKLEIRFAENVSIKNIGKSYLQKCDAQEGDENIELLHLSANNEETPEHSNVNKEVCEEQNKYIALSQHEKSIEINVDELHVLDVTNISNNAKQVCDNQYKQIQNEPCKTTLKTADVEEYAQCNSNCKNCSTIVDNPSKSYVDNSREIHHLADFVECESVLRLAEGKINQDVIQTLKSNILSKDDLVFQSKPLSEEILIDDNKSKSSSIEVNEFRKNNVEIGKELLSVNVCEDVSKNIVVAKKDKDNGVNFLNDHCTSKVYQSEEFNSAKNLEEEMEKSKEMDDHKICFPERSNIMLECDEENTVTVASNTSADMECIDENTSIVNKPEYGSQVPLVYPKTNFKNILINKDANDVHQCYEGTEIEYSSAELNFSINYESSTNQGRNNSESLSPARDEIIDENNKCDFQLNIQKTIDTNFSDDSITNLDRTRVDNCDLFGINEDEKESLSPTNFQDKPLCENTHSDQNELSNMKNCFEYKDSNDNTGRNEISSEYVLEIPVVESESVISLKRKLLSVENNDILKNQRIESCTIAPKEIIINSENECAKSQLETKSDESSEFLLSEEFEEDKMTNVEENMTSNCTTNKDPIAKENISVQNINDQNSSNETCSENIASQLNCISEKESSYVRKSCDKLLPDNNCKVDFKNVEEESKQCDPCSTLKTISIQKQNEEDINKLNGIISGKERVSEFSSRSNNSGECKELQFNVVSHLDSNNARFTKCETVKSFSKKPVRKKLLKTQSRKRSKKPRQYKPSLSNVKMEKICEKTDEFVRHTDTLLFKVEKRESEICDVKGDKVDASIVTSFRLGHNLQSIVGENKIETRSPESSNLSPENDTKPNNNGVDIQKSEIQQNQLKEKVIETANTCNNQSDVQVLKFHIVKDKVVKETVNHVSTSNLPDNEQSKPKQNINGCDKVIEKELLADNVDSEFMAESKELGCSTVKSDFLSEETVEKQMEAMYGSQSIHSDDINEERVYLGSSISSGGQVVFGEISLSENNECFHKINTVCSGVDDNVVQDCDNTVQNEIVGNLTIGNDNINSVASSDPQSINLLIPVYDSVENIEETTSTKSQKDVIKDTHFTNDKQLYDGDLITEKHDKECNTDFPTDSVSNLMKMSDLDTTPFQCLVEAALAVETADANKMAVENSSKTFENDNSSKMFSGIQNVNNSEMHGKNIFESDSINTEVVVKKCKTKYRFPKPKLKVITKAKKFKDKTQSYLNGNSNSKTSKYIEKEVSYGDIHSDNLSETSAEIVKQKNGEVFLHNATDGSDTENQLLSDRLICNEENVIAFNENVSQTFTTTSENKTVPHSNTIASQEVVENIESNESVSDVLYVHVDSEELNEYVNEINLRDAKVITEIQTDEDVGLENEIGVQNNLKLPNVELETGTNLVIIIEGLDTGETSGTLLERGIDIVTSCNNLEGRSEEKCKQIPTEEIIVSNDDHLNDVPNLDTSLVNSEVSKTYNNVGYDGLNANLSNDIANWPYVEEEVMDVDSNIETDVVETSINLLSSIKCSLPWERIFNISNSKKRKIKRNKKMFASNGLELGPAKIELRLASESGAWKVVNYKQNDCVSPIVNVKRLILQRDPELVSYSEKESEEEIDVRERRKSLSQSTNDSLLKKVVGKKNETELLRLADDKRFQPVVFLIRDKELDNLCQSMNANPNSNISVCSNHSVNKVQKKKKKTGKDSVTHKNDEKETKNEDQKSDGSEFAEELFPHNTDREDDISLTDSIDPAQEYVWRCLDNEEDWMDRSPLQNYCDQKSGKESFDEDDLTFSSNDREQSFNDSYSYVNDHERRLPENGDIIETEYESNKSKDWKHLHDSESVCSQKESIIGTKKSDILQSLSFIFSKNRNRGVKRPSEGHSKEDTKRRRRQRIEKYPFHCRKCCIGFKTKEEMDRHKDSRHPPHRELHHCLLCQRSFSSSLRHSLHVEGRSHRHLELVQRHTMHAVHKLLMGVDFPRIRPLSHSERLALDWRPNQPGCVHYYHQLTPLQAALQDYSTRQDSSSGGQLEVNKKTNVLQSSSETTK